MKIALIAAMAANRVIGRNNSLPWHVPSDLQRFRRLTMGHTLLMGRRTFESIGKLLDGRRTIILSRDPSFCVDGADVATDFDAALELAREAELLFICGGEKVFRQGLELAERIYLTQLHDAFEGDRFFPEIPMDKYREVWHEQVEDCYDYSFTILEVCSDQSLLQKSGS